jgi:hypothetical protein
MSTPVEGCPCGEAHRFSTEKIANSLRYFIKTLGPAVEVSMNGRCWKVPRLYIAAHGLKGSEIEPLAERYGWPEVSVVV